METAKEMKMSRKNKWKSNNPPIGTHGLSFLDMTIPIKYIITGGFALSLAIFPLIYSFGKWMQKTEDHLMLTKKEQELNALRSQLTIDFNEKLIDLQRKNASLETKLEFYERKEAENGK